MDKLIPSLTNPEGPAGARVNLFDLDREGLERFFAETLGELAIFGGLAATLFAFAVVLWTLSGMLVRWTHGAEETRH